MNQEKLNNDFQEKLKDLNNRYQQEYDELYQQFLGKSFDTQICDKLNTILEKNLILTPFGFPMSGFDYNNLTLYPPELARIKQVFEKEVE